MPTLPTRSSTLLPPPDQTTTPSQLVARARAGDAAALGELYDRHAGRLLALARRLTGSAQDAEDVLHDVFLGLPEALRRYDERGTLDAWLRRVTARVALNQRRSSDRRREAPLLDDAPARAGDVGNVIDAMALEQAIAALPDSLRAVFVLKEVEGFSHAEVGGLLHISAGASEVRLHRAIKALRQFLEPSR